MKSRRLLALILGVALGTSSYTARADQDTATNGPNNSPKQTLGPGIPVYHGKDGTSGSVTALPGKEGGPPSGAAAVIVAHPDIFGGGGSTQPIRPDEKAAEPAKAPETAKAAEPAKAPDAVIAPAHGDGGGGHGVIEHPIPSHDTDRDSGGTV